MSAQYLKRAACSCIDPKKRQNKLHLLYLGENFCSVALSYHGPLYIHQLIAMLETTVDEETLKDLKLDKIKIYSQQVKNVVTSHQKIKAVHIVTSPVSNPSHC